VVRLAACQESKSSTAQPAESDLLGRIDRLLAIRTERWLIGVMRWAVVRLSLLPIVAVSSPAARGHTLPVAPYRPSVCPPVYLLVRGVLIWTIRRCSSWLDALARRAGDLCGPCRSADGRSLALLVVWCHLRLTL